MININANHYRLVPCILGNGDGFCISGRELWLQYGVRLSPARTTSRKANVYSMTVAQLHIV